jgi:hypothetical protein
MEILRESATKQYRPLFRGTVPLMGHSLASATTGLVGQPELEKYINRELRATSNMGSLVTGLISSAIVSPIYIVMTNPLSRLEVIMQTSSIKGKSITLLEACKEIATDSKTYGLRGIFRGQESASQRQLCRLRCFIKVAYTARRRSNRRTSVNVAIEETPCDRRDADVTPIIVGFVTQF